MQLSCIKNSGLNLHLAQILCSSVELRQRTQAKPIQGKQTPPGKAEQPGESWAQPVTWLCRWPGDRTCPLGSAGLREAKRKSFKGCSLLWSGKLLSVHGSLGFCVWLTDYALRQCLEMSLAVAPGLCSAAEGAHPLLQKKHLPAAQPPLPCLAWTAWYLEQPRLGYTVCELIYPLPWLLQMKLEESTSSNAEQLWTPNMKRASAALVPRKGVSKVGWISAMAQCAGQDHPREESVLITHIQGVLTQTQECYLMCSSLLSADRAAYPYNI